MPRREHYPDGIAFLLRDTYGAFAREYQADLADAGITMSMFYFLHALARHDGLSQRELMEGVGLMQPATSAALKKMEAMRLAVRKPDAQDARVVRFYMTAKARRLVEKKLAPASARLRARAVGDFTAEEMQTLRSLLRRMKTNLEKDKTVSVGDQPA